MAAATSRSIWLAARIAPAVHGGLPPVCCPRAPPAVGWPPSRPPAPPVREGPCSGRFSLEPGLSRHRSEGWREAGTGRSAAAHGWLVTSGLPDSPAGRRGGLLPRAAATVTRPRALHGGEPVAGRPARSSDRDNPDGTTSAPCWIAAQSPGTSSRSMAAICAGAVMSLAWSPCLARVTRICTAARYPRPAGTVTARRDARIRGPAGE